MSSEVPDNKTEEVKAQVQTTQDQSAVQTEPDNQEINWKKFKEARAAERKEAEAQAKRAEEAAKRAAEKEAEATALKAALDAILNKPQKSQSNSYQSNDDEEETEDQRIEKKVAAVLLQREQEAERKRNEREQEELPIKLKNTLKDFDQICSSDNLDYLEYHHPELSRSLGSRPQSLEKWHDIYNAVLRYIPNTNAKKDQQKAMANFQKPQSISSPNVTQPGNSISSAKDVEARRAANWQRMQAQMGRI